MKRRVSRMAVLVSLMVLILGVGSVMATSAPYYESWCVAYSNTTSDVGETHAMATDSETSAEAKAVGWALGAQADMYIENEFSGGAYAQASFTQTFEVTAVGSASINFSYEGWLSIANLGDGSAEDMWADTSFSVYAYDDLENEGGDSYNLMDIGENFPSGTFSFTYNFTDEDVGSLFYVTLELNASVSSEYINYIGDGGLNFISDFYNTAELTDYSGGIDPLGGPPVPIPGALWLLGSGLFGLMAVRRRT